MKPSSVSLLGAALLAAAIGTTSDAFSAKPDPDDSEARHRMKAEREAQAKKMAEEENARQQAIRNRISPCHGRKPEIIPGTRWPIHLLTERPFDMDRYVILAADSVVLSSADEGMTWSPDELPVGAEPTAVDVSNAYVIVGLRGLILRKLSGKWHPVASNTTENLHDIRFDGKRGFIVGENGTVLFSEDYGETWRKERVVGGPDLEWIGYFGPGQATAKTRDGRMFAAEGLGKVWTEFEAHPNGHSSKFHHDGQDRRHFDQDESGWSIVTPQVVIPPPPCGRPFIQDGRHIMAAAVRRSGW